MDQEKKQTQQVHDAHLKGIMKTWLLVIPIIVGIIGTGVMATLWVVTREGASRTQTVNYRISSVDELQLNNIRANFSHTYLQYLQARINPNSRSGQVEQLEQRLIDLVQEGKKIVLKYDPEHTFGQASVLSAISLILLKMPGPIAYTFILGFGIMLFVLTRSMAFFVIKRRYSLDRGSDYIREA